MHPTKAKLLASLEATSASVDRIARHHLHVLGAPREHGPIRFGFALALLPLWAVSAVLGDLSHVMISRTDDALWDRLPPLEPPRE